MYIRLKGSPEQVEAAAATLRKALEVLTQSCDYPNRWRSRLVRRYVTTADPRPRIAAYVEPQEA